jgi:hypothetical protein
MFIQPILNSSIFGESMSGESIFGGPIPSRGVPNGPSVMLMVESVAGLGVYLFFK